MKNSAVRITEVFQKQKAQTEELFKAGELRGIIATSTLELGIDVGSVDFIVQVSAPLSVSGGLRLGRAGHRLSAVSGVIIPKRAVIWLSPASAEEMLNAY